METSVGAGDGSRTHDFLLGKPLAQPEFVSNQLILETFIAFKKATKGLTISGEKWLRVTLGPFLQWLSTPLPDATKQHIIQFLAQYEGKPWRRHSFYRAFKTFWKWLAEEYQLDNLMTGIPAPKTPDVVLHTITPTDIDRLIQEANTSRDKAIIALLADSGARRSELASTETEDLDLENYRIKVVGKGNKEGYLVFGPRTAELLKQHIEESQPTDRLFGLNSYGVQTMLRRLEEQTGIKCNAHAFRRGFATALRHAGVGELDIQQLGRWSSLEMVRRYTKAYTFDDAAKRYKPIVT